MDVHKKDINRNEKAPSRRSVQLCLYLQMQGTLLASPVTGVVWFSLGWAFQIYIDWSFKNEETI